MTLIKPSPSFKAYGASADLLAATRREILFEGAANTGKTRTVLEKCKLIMEDRSLRGVRQLWVRKTRKSLSQSVLVEWEQNVIRNDHPCKVGSAHRGNRDFYYNPATDCEIVLGGMDNPDRIMSTQYDIIAFFEATEGVLRDWEQLSTRVRNKKIRVGTKRNGNPLYWHQMIADCNPGPEFHWLNQRALSGKMQRIKARHRDNPVFDEEDQAALDALTGSRRARLRDGLWVSEEGQIWDCWEPSKMMAYRGDYLANPDDRSEGYDFDWLFGSMDFGRRHAGVFQVWGVKGETMVMVAEVYKREKSILWWADAIEKQLDRWDLERIVADSEDMSAIEYLNDRLGPMGGKDESPLVEPCEKGPGSRRAGFEQVYDLMEQGRIVLCHDALEGGPCEVSARAYLPTCTAEEIPSFRWKPVKEGQAMKEDSDPLCTDDGCFAMIYAARWRWGKDFTDRRRLKFVPGSMGDVMEHQDVLSELLEDDGYSIEHTDALEFTL